MQMRKHELSGTQLEQQEDGSEAPSSQPWNGLREIEHDLRRYDDEEVITKPWPPFHHW